MKKKQKSSDKDTVPKWFDEDKNILIKLLIYLSFIIQYIKYNKLVRWMKLIDLFDILKYS